MSGRQMVPGSAEMQEEGTQYRQRPWVTRSAAARMLSTVPSCTVGVKPGGPAHLDGELVEFRGLDLFGEQQRLGGQHGDGDGVQCGEPVAGGDQDPERVVAEQVGGDLGRGERGPADADVQPAVGELLGASRRTPSSRSSRCTCWLSADCTMCSRAAARPKCSSSASVTK